MYFRVLSLMASAALIAGCLRVPILYAPPAAQIPISAETGEGELAFHWGKNGIDLNGSYSPVEHLELTALGSYFDRLDDSLEHSKHSYMELGAAGYTELAESVTGSFSAGVGFGDATGVGGEDDTTQPGAGLRTVSGSYLRPFAQLGLGYARPRRGEGPFDILELGVAARLAWVRFASLQGPEGTRSAEGLFLEPLAIGRIGYNAVQLEVQTGFTVQYGSSDVKAIESFSTIGLHLSLNEIF